MSFLPAYIFSLGSASVVVMLSALRTISWFLKAVEVFNSSFTRRICGTSFN